MTVKRLLRTPKIVLAALALLSPVLWTAHRAGAHTDSGPDIAPSQTSTLAWPNLSFELVAGGFASPVFVTHAGDDSGRIFVVEQAGRIQIIQNGVVLEQPFLDIHDRVRSPASGGGGEEGLLSLAFAPDYAQNGRFYVYYTNQDGNNVLARFQVTSDPDRADAGSEHEILLFPHPNFENHNGGLLDFGPDGYLYIGTGDGGGGGDPQGNAQNPGSLLGKLLRIDAEFQPTSSFTPTHQAFLPLIRQANGNSSLMPYRIPPDNPFVRQSGYREEIWALGLRNPWRYSFDLSTGDLYIADVGQNLVEEVDFQPADSPGGQNYGWNIMEGDRCYQSVNCDTSGLTLPIFTYTHTYGCSITGGYVYRGPNNPGMRGIYFFADYCSGRIWGLQKSGNSWTHQILTQTSYNVSSFGEDQAGRLYLVDKGGSVYRVVEAAP
jgi:glucose/arabinose dehydrogenase